ncbi:MAG: hypothetical protein P9M05_04965 [Candidatus Stygibacter australis]|nr:hypothetical protein [Candidatus Stygibacter australis]
MKKIIIFTILLGFLSSLCALTFRTADESLELDSAALYAVFPSELVTEKEEDGELVKRFWQGIKLSDLLKKFNQDNYDLVKFSSEDNYLVRLTKEEIITHDPLIALYLNEEKLTGNRLVISDMPGMYWISDIRLIQTEIQARLSQPHTLYFAENYLADIKISADPEPFVNAEGYYLPQLLQLLMPSMEGQYQLTGRDGISNLLDFNDYLARAVLVKSETGYILQSPQMPGGMWIKNIAYIQKGDTAIIFRSQFKDWQEVQSLIEWQDLPQEFISLDSSKNYQNLSIELPLDQSDWDDVLKLSW